MMQLIEVPFRFLGFVVGTTGRLLAFIIGLLLLVIGGVLTLTVVGGILGIPLMIVGLILVVRAFF